MHVNIFRRLLQGISLCSRAHRLSDSIPFPNKHRHPLKKRIRTDRGQREQEGQLGCAFNFDFYGSGGCIKIKKKLQMKTWFDGSMPDILLFGPYQKVRMGWDSSFVSDDISFYISILSIKLAYTSVCTMWRQNQAAFTKRKRKKNLIIVRRQVRIDTDQD